MRPAFVMSCKVQCRHLVTRITRPVRQCTNKRKGEARSPNYFWHGKAISIIFSERVFVALIIQHAMCMRHVILSSVSARLYSVLSKWPHKRHDFFKKVIDHKICVF